VGTNQHILGEWFNREAGLALCHVPYRGAGPAINDLIAGHVKIAWLGPTAAVPQSKEGNLRLLAQAAAKAAHSAALPPPTTTTSKERFSIPTFLCKRPFGRPFH
jgi:tripartite-type tricarboxylate transporter receptor subunit TctC